jgi:probable rRNA maturation factor
MVSVASPEAGRGRAPGAGDDVAVEVQRAVRAWAPSRARIGSWVRAAVGRRGAGLAVAVRVVGAAESRRLNRGWRRQDHATNVLSFPAPRARLPRRATTAAAPPRSLGDLVICAPVLAREAREQGKPVVAHWAHLVVHGSLHLLGFDHQRDADARRMERREKRVLAALGFPDPYSDPMQGKA